MRTLFFKVPEIRKRNDLNPLGVIDLRSLLDLAVALGWQDSHRSLRREEIIEKSSAPSERRHKVLILGVSVGSGHMRAAEAVARALSRESSHLDVRIEDLLDHGDRLYRFVYRNTYLFLARRLPEVLDRLYDWTDRMPSWLSRILPWMDRLVFRGFLSSLGQDSPDLILCTHFLPLEILSPLRRNDRLPAPLWGVVTDIHPHGIWIWPGVDEYIVCSPKARERIQGDTPDAAVRDWGIPVLPEFSRGEKREDLLEKLQLPDRKTVLVLSGGEGVEDLPSLLESFRKGKTPVTLVAIAGKNRSLLKRCRNWASAYGSDTLGVKALEYVHNMHEWMAVADVIVSKPGGLTLFEALASGKPLALLPARGGQERINREWAIASGSAIGIIDPRETGAAVLSLCEDTARLEKMTANSTFAGRPDAACRLARAILQHLEEQDQPLIRRQ